MKHLLLLIMLSGCASFRYKGFNIYDRQNPESNTSISKQQLTQLIDYDLSLLKKDRVNGVNLLIRSQVLIYPTGKPNEVVVADGEYRLGQTVSFGVEVRQLPLIILVTNKPCFADNSLLHELHHYYFLDEFHTNKNLWNQVKRLENEMINKFCGKDYDQIIK